MEPLSLEATPTFEEYRRAYALPTRRRIFYNCWPSLFSFLVAVVSLAAGMDIFGLIVISLVLGCQLVYTAVELATVLRRGFDESPAWNLSYRFEFDDGGVSIITEHSQRRYAWAAIHRCTEGTHFFKLSTRDGEYTLVPKRQLSPTECDRLRKILREKTTRNPTAK